MMDHWSYLYDVAYEALCECDIPFPMRKVVFQAAFAYMNRDLALATDTAEEEDTWS